MAGTPVPALEKQAQVETVVRAERTGFVRKSETQLQKQALALRHPQLANRLESRLTEAWEQAASGKVQGAIQNLKRQNTLFAENGEDVIVVVSHGNEARATEVESAIRQRGAVIIRSGGGTIKIAAPIANLGEIATIPGVVNVRTVKPPKLKNVTKTQGVAKTMANVWHNAGFTGQGIKVAVVDYGFANLATLKAQDEIPSGAVEVNYTGSAMTSGFSSHGSACSEIIYDMAPGAQFHLIKIDDPTDLVVVKDYCVSNGIKVVSFSLGWDGMNFHDGTAQPNWFSSVANHPVTAVNLAATNDIVWVASAGNEQLQHTLIDWRDGGSPDGALDWNASQGDLNVLWLDGTTSIPAGTLLDIFLTWNRWPTTDQDFDLELWRNTGLGWTQITSGFEGGWSGDDLQNGDGISYPYEEILYETPVTAQYAVAVFKYSATSAPTFILRYYGVDEPNYFGYGNVSTPPPGSLSIPADAASAFTVGAIDEATYPAGTIEFFSSLGPNNRAYTGGAAVTKPDVCGPDWTTSVTYGIGSFGGTSASAPHVAGLAALVRGAFPAFMQAQTKAYLEAQALDLGTSGKDNTYGAGAARLPMPPLSLAIFPSGTNVTLTWSGGALQHADSLLGPYSNVTGAISPYTIAASAARKYYRTYYVSP